MLYVSTRGEAKRLSFEDVMLAGLARDGGLYVPESWPVLTEYRISSFAGREFADVAADVMAPFVATSMDRETLHAIAADAYRDFGHPAVAPLVELSPGVHVLELFHGPTLAFKDVAMQLLARLMDRALKRRNRTVTVVGATSGDTGGAAIEAFRAANNIDVVILFPDGAVSDVQRRMMTTHPEAHVRSLAIKGSFDDCQALVKAMFNDHAFRDRLNLAAVNSINWARILAQVTYYFTAAVAAGAPKRGVSFAVPTGNFGDIFAGWVARRMGLPIDQLIIASNENDILPRAHASGLYETRPVKATSSPSMDIQVSSNFERYLFEASNRDSRWIEDSMRELARTGSFKLGERQAAVRRDFEASAASEDEIAMKIRAINETHGYLPDPHTACGLVALDKVAAPSGSKAARVVLATAHPAKFPDAMEGIMGTRPGLPPRLSNLMSATERYDVLPNDLATVQSNILDHASATRRGAA